jgi:hypothetical protein
MNSIYSQSDCLRSVTVVLSMQSQKVFSAAPFSVATACDSVQMGLVPIRALPGMVGGPPITVRYLMPTNLSLNRRRDWPTDPRDHDETATAFRY